MVDRGTDHRVVIALCALFVIPWTVIVVESGDVSLVFAWGLVTPIPLGVTTLPEYLFVLTRGVPDFVLAWPASVVLYVGAMLSALGGTVGREDRRVTAGLLALAGLSNLFFVIDTHAHNPAAIAVLPLGTLAMWAVVWRFYWPALRRLVGTRPIH